MSTAVVNLLAVATGGALGACARWWLSGVIYKHMGTGFPWATLGVNVIGSLLMGVLFVFVMDKALPDAWRLVLAVGMLGSFTTFSTFSLDTLILIENGDLLRALLNILFSVALCLVAVFAGAGLARVVTRALAP